MAETMMIIKEGLSDHERLAMLNKTVENMLAVYNQTVDTPHDMIKGKRLIFEDAELRGTIEHTIELCVRQIAGIISPSAPFLLTDVEL